MSKMIIESIAADTGKSAAFVQKKLTEATEAVKEQYPDLSGKKFDRMVETVTRKLVGVTEEIVARHKRVMEGQKFSTKTLTQLNKTLFRMKLINEEEFKGLRVINECSCDDTEWPVTVDETGDVTVGSKTLPDIALDIETDAEATIQFDDYADWVDYFDGTETEIYPFDEEGSYEAYTLDSSVLVGFWDGSTNTGWANAILPEDEYELEGDI